MILLLGGLVVCIAIGIPIAFSLGVSALTYFFVYQPDLISILPQRIFSGFNSEAMIALPLFILMGQMMNSSGITRRIIDFSNLFFGKFKGGMGGINVFASMIFGGISGSSASDTASVGAILIPEMERKGYPLEYASGITVASSTMGMIIPPSVPMILYAVLAEESVGKLFLAGAIPGLLIGVFQIVINFVLAYKRDYPREDFKYSFKFVFDTIKDSMVALIMPLFVVGTVVFGVATANESAAFGVMYAMVIGVLVFKGIKWKELPALFVAAMKTCASIMIIIAISQLYIWILALEHVPQDLAAYVVSMDLNPQALLTVIMVIILISGTFIDVSPAILLLTPVFLPAAVAVGISPLQFGGLLIAGLAVGAVTPPVGTCLNVAAAISKLSIAKIFRGAAPFLIGNVSTLILICFVQPITLWLPSLLFVT
jgi:tripartite ATP-independent transporter DctM subunit